MQIRPGPSDFLMFHKPKGVIVTRRDERNRKSVYDVLPAWVYTERWMPVGRLDRDTRGLLLLTNRGDMIDRLTRPHACLKKYEVWVRGHVQDWNLKSLLDGLASRGEILRAVHAERIGAAGSRSRLLISLDEGRNRHIRRMMALMKDPVTGRSFKVMDLKRIAFGPVRLDIPSGQWRFLTPGQVSALICETERPSQRVLSGDTKSFNRRRSRTPVPRKGPLVIRRS
ncbi:rRNA pseudouridine synthase [bacterium]|nr:rRNA pseudouridine synthase [bacterium]